jgi:hypothetical protein
LKKENVKVLEIRDAGTTIPVLAIRPVGETDGEHWAFWRSGYGGPEDAVRHVMLLRIDDGKCESDPLKWTGSRTMRIAHQRIREAWDHIKSEDVIDVEYILGERGVPKQPERLRR